MVGILSRCLLDSQMFPHIMDEIISYASYSVLVTLRATCKAYENRITPMIGEHVKVETGVVTAVDGRFPSWEHPNKIPYAVKEACAQYRHDYAAGLSRRPIDPDLALKIRMWDLDRMHKYIQHSKVVDICGPVKLDFLRGLLMRTQSPTLRIKKSKFGQRFSTHRMWDLLQHVNVDRIVSFESLGNDNSGGTWFRAARVVLNYSFVAERGIRRPHDVALCIETLRELVIVFRPATKSRAGFASVHLYTLLNILQRVAEHLVDTLLVYGKPVKVTIVGFESLPPRAILCPDIPSSREWGGDDAVWTTDKGRKEMERVARNEMAGFAHRAIIEEEGKKAFELNLNEVVIKLASGVEFLTLDEFRQTMSPEQFKIETDEGHIYDYDG